MTIIHVDTVNATQAAAGGTQEVDLFPVLINAVPAPLASSAYIYVFGQGHGNEGQWQAEENGSTGGDGFPPTDWLVSPTRTADEYFTRIINSTNNNPVTSEETRYTSANWSNYQTTWKSLATSSPGSGMNADNNHIWGAASNYASADREIAGTLEIGRLDSTQDLNFEPAQVALGSDSFNLTAHGLLSGDVVQCLQGSGTLPSPLVSGTFYNVIKTSDNTFQLATNMANAASSTQINLTFSGTGSGHIFRPIVAKDSAFFLLNAGGFA